MQKYNCYIHIPFCSSKCKYCRFASFGVSQELQINNYVDFLCREIDSFKISPDSTESGLKNKLDTIYFGGGTPSVLNKNQFEKIFFALKNKYNFSENIELNIESTPENISINNIKSWKELGINRLSIGVQTLNEESLKEIGRAGKGDILKALDNIKIEGFDNVSIDFIIGLPYVKKGEINENIEFLLKKYGFIKHISVYMLEEYYEIPEDKENKFDNITYPNNWNKLGISENDYLEEYINIKALLEKNNIFSYEISNFAKIGYECKHNLGYWNHKETLAFGLASHSFINNTRYSNSDNFLDYYNYKNISIDKLNKEDLFLEEIMFSLRTSGIDFEKMEKLNTEKLNYFIENGYLEKKEKIKITNKGILVIDYILSEII